MEREGRGWIGAEELGRDERGFSPVAVVGGNGVIVFLEQFGSGMCASFEFLAEILSVFFWGGGGGVGDWGGGGWT